MYKILFVIFFIFLASCEKTDFEIAQQEIIEEMEWLYTADPLEDHEAAIKRKDYRFLGIYGAKLITPGVEIECINWETDVNPIKGTSDAIIGYEHDKLISIATAYARNYNFRMEQYLREKGLFKCNS